MWDEADRLRALRSYGILDAPDTGMFEDFVKVAAVVCEAPTAVISLFDEARQWFAAEVGLGVREIPLGAALCVGAALGPGLTVVPDLALDQRLDGNPLMGAATGSRFYAGVLLRTADDLPLGVLCVLGHEPRPCGLTDRQAFTLGTLARQVIAQLDLRRALRQMTAEASAKDVALRCAEDLAADRGLKLLEAHHRIKNDLANVQALLLLQARIAGNDHAAAPLRQGTWRVRAFGAMHEHLCDTASASEIDVAEYLRIFTSQSAGPLEGRFIRLDVASIRWPRPEAQALGMIVAELLTNALRHGAGHMTVTFRQVDDEAVLTVEDEGNLPDGFDPASSKGLGMKLLVGLLAGRLQGRIDVDRTRGPTCFVVTMRAPEA